MTNPKFKRGDHVRKVSGSQWTGFVVGEYSTELTPEGYAVESSTERGSVQIYPAKALELAAQQDELAREAGCDAAVGEGHKHGVKSTDSLRIVAAYLNAAHGITKGNT